MVSGHRAPWRRLAALLLLLLAAGFAQVAEAALNALLERSAVTLGESVRLVLETDGQVGGSGPDLSPLERDFEVLATSRSTQVQIANSRQTATTRWVVELLPRRAGSLVVPPVTPAGGDAGQDLYMEAEIEPGNHYVQSQLVYRVRLYSAVPVLGGRISPPEAPRTSVERIGEDVNFSAMRNGRRYDVVERRYALFPQEPGRLTVGASRFTGQIGASRGGLSAMDRLLNRGRRASVAAAPVEVTVLPRPDHFDGDPWLPARDLRLTEDWPNSGREFRVGEPVTRILRLSARGLPASQLELPAMADIEGLRLYPDQAQRDSGHEDEWMTANVEQRVAMIPTRAGTLLLPEVRLRWWDVVADRGRTAVLPARTITVLPAPDAGSGSTGTTIVATPDPVPAAEPAPAAVPWYWPASVATLGLLWLSTLYALWRRRGRTPPRPAGAPPGVDPRSETARAARNRVVEACLRNDAAAARAALFAFGRAAWPGHPPTSLDALASRLGDRALADQFHVLDRVLYGPAPGGEWSGERLRLLAGRLTLPAGPAPARRAATPLPPLNPGRPAPDVLEV